MDKPRHFKLKVTTFDNTIFRLFFNSFVTPNIFKDGEYLEVIEYSAYEQLKKENAELKSEIKYINTQVKVASYKLMLAEITQLKSKLKVAVEAITEYSDLNYAPKLEEALKEIGEV